VFPWLWIWYKYWEEQRRQQQPQGGGSPAPGPFGVFRWFHQDGEIVNATIDALDTAKRGTWRGLSHEQLVRQFRALVLATLRAATLSSAEPGQLGELGSWLYSTRERNAAASALARTLAILAPDRLRATQDMASEGAQPATSHFDVGLGPIVGLVVRVALGCVAALSAAFLGTVVAQAVAGVNFDDEVTKRLLSTHARALELMSMHVERERIAGHEIPFSEEERGLLESLEQQQRQLATLQRRPLPTPFEGASTFAKTASLSLLPLAAVAAAVFLFGQTEKGR